MMRWFWVCGAVVALASACGKVDSGGDGTGDGDGDGVDHRDGGGGGQPDAIGPVDDCEPGEPIACDGSELRVCNAAGDGEERVTCGLRCDPDGLVCEDIIDPSNGFAALLDGAEDAPALVIDGGGTVFFDSDYNVDEDAGTGDFEGTVVPVTVVPVAGPAPDVVVVPVASLRVAAGSVLSLQGPRAVVFVSWGDVRIQGELRSLAGRSEEVEEDCWGRPSGGVGANNDISGPGGGSFASAGGSGGAVVGTSGAAGKAAGDLIGNLTLVPLRGGCPGGADGIGGAGIGGGAVQISSRTLITVPGAIGASGGGGCVSSGGGSGGAILLEAPAVTVGGGVYANGGSGGCGGFSCGEAGSLSTTPAPGDDACADGSGAYGGDGAAVGVDATSGDDVTNTPGATDRAGGGGGGLGRIRINTLDGTIMGASTFSPDPSLGQVAGR